MRWSRAEHSDGGWRRLVERAAARFQHIAASFRMAQFQPESSRNETAVANYARNRLRVVRQVHFSTADNRSIDMVLFVNGIPVATIELKTDFTQSVDDAVEQYRRDRKPKTNGRDEPLLGFGTRALVHFAVSNVEVRMTTRLAGRRPTSYRSTGEPPTAARATRQLPTANRPPRTCGKKSSPATRCSASSAGSCTWRRWWPPIRSPVGKTARRGCSSRVSTNGMRCGSSPRRRLQRGRPEVPHPALRGLGEDQHHRVDGAPTRTTAGRRRKVFDTVIVVTDRNVLDAQLQDALKQISNDAGIVASIDAKAVQKAGAGFEIEALTAALDSGKLIIVVTLQTFPFVAEELGGLVDKRFAVIADEAHSSQTGQAATKLKSVLTRAEIADLGDGGEVDTEALLAAAAPGARLASNISYYAFTATPKAKTLEIFGRTPPGGDKPEPSTSIR